MRRYSDRHSLHTLAELNVTPLLDLAFVLLIIFIITTPLMDNKMDVVLPSSAASRNAVDPAAVQTVVLHPDGHVSLNGQDLSLSSLQAELGRIRENRAEAAVIVRSHRDLSVQKLIDVMDVVKRSGISKVGVATQPDQP